MGGIRAHVTNATSERPAAARFETRAVTAVAIAHMVHDAYPGFLGVLLPILIARFDLSLAAAGLLASVVTLASLSQPVLGYVIDRGEARRWVAATLAASAAFFSLVTIAPDPLTIFVLLALGGLSVSAFHPAAGALVTRMAAAQWGKATSIFMAGGPLGSALGPVAIAAVIGVVGIGGAWIAIVPGLVFAAVLTVGLRRMAGRIVREPPGDIRTAVRRHGRALAILVLAVVFQSGGMVGFITFYPTLATGRGQSLVEAGLGLALFQAGGAGGSLLGGWLSDRFGRRVVLLVSTLVGVPTLLGALLVGVNPVHLPLLALAGALLMSSGSVQMVMIQELLPENRSLAAGVMFFVGIGAASLASIAVGILGDVVGLEQAVLLGTGAGLLATPFILLLPDRRPAVRPAPTRLESN